MDDEKLVEKLEKKYNPRRCDCEDCFTALKVLEIGIQEARKDERLKIKLQMGDIKFENKNNPGKKLRLRYMPWFEEFWEKKFHEE